MPRLSRGRHRADSQGRRWYVWLALVSFVGLCIRVVYVLVSKRQAVPGGDAFYFHLQANLLVNGKGWFIDPWAYIHHHQVVESAYHPPLWSLVLAAPSAIGAKSYLSQLLWACVVGTAAVFVTGLAGREVGGPRAGLIAAGIAAVYPNYWLNDGSGLAETLVLFLIAAVVLVSYKLWRRPSLSNVAILGALCGLAALTRSELSLLVVLVLIPVCLVLRSLSAGRRIAIASVGASVALLVVAPWIGFNLSRFNHVEIISTEFGSGLASANCNQTYRGPLTGYWSFGCQVHRNCAVLPIQKDESAWDARCRRIGLSYIERHQTRLPVVMTARIGREFGVFDPIQQLRLDGGHPALSSFETRPFVWAAAGLVMYYLLLVASVFGALTLRKRRLTLVPLVGILAGVVVAAVLIYGTTRFRSPFEVVLAVLAAPAIDRAVRRFDKRRAQRLHHVAMNEQTL